jgi:putative membrane-bound dehydrogenase-like protein
VFDPCATLLFRLLFSLSLFARMAGAEITPATDAAQPKSPEESLKHFQLPPGFEMQLVAAEPLISEPSAILFDDRGRLFVCELHGYNLEGHLDVTELNKTGKLDRTVRRVRVEGELFEKAKRQRSGRIKLLLDTNDDGRMDEARLWADNLPACYGMVAHQDGLIVVCGPDIVFLADRDDDARAEVRELLFTGFDVELMERAINNPRRGLDGWIYVAAGGGAAKVTGPRLDGSVSLARTDFRFKPDGTQLEPATGVNATFGQALSDFGDRFLITTSAPAVYAIPIPQRYIARNPFVPAPSGNAHAAAYNRVYPTSQPDPWRLARGSDPNWVKFYGAQEATPNGYFTSGSGPLIYRAAAFPEEYHGNYFCCDPSQNLVHRCLLQRDAAGFRAERAPGEQQSEFLTSRDQWFRPINLSTGPDGAIYIVDFYREIIEDYSAIPRYLQQQYGLLNGAERGRIWRLAPIGTSRVRVGNHAKLSVSELVRHLEHHNAWWREAAQRILIERGDSQAVPALAALIRSGRTPQARLHALCTLAGLNRLRPEDVQVTLRDTSYGLRVHGLRMSESFAAKQSSLLKDVIACIDDDDASVRLQAALTLGEFHQATAIEALATLASRHGQERWMADAIVSSVPKSSDELIGRILAKHKESEGARTTLQPLASCVGARHDETELTRLLVRTASLSTGDSELQILLLEGLAAGLERGRQSPLPSPDASKAIQQLLTKGTAEQQLLALRVARLLEIDVSQLMQDAWNAAINKILDSDESLVARRSALVLVAQSPWPTRKELAKLLEPRHPGELQMAAVQALSTDEYKSVPHLLLANWSSLSPDVQESITEALFARIDRLPDLLTAMEHGDVAPGSLSALRRMQLLEHGDTSIRERAARVLATSTTAERAEVLEKYQPVLQAAGDVKRGRKVFDAQCATCHRLDGRGFAVGPDLSAVQGRPAAALLGDILDPSGSVEPGFRAYTVVTNDGRTYTGVLAEETATSVVLRRTKGEQDVLLRKDIEEMTVLSQSLMPERMEDVVTQPDMADLLAYLREALGPELPSGIVLFDDEADLVRALHQGEGTIELNAADKFSGDASLRVTPLQRHSPRVPDWKYAIREHPRPGEYRYMRMAWKTEMGEGIMIELAADGAWPPADRAVRRYYCGQNTTDWQARQLARDAARKWTVLTVDLWRDGGDFTLTGIAPTALGGAALFDRIELLRTLD